VGGLGTEAFPSVDPARTARSAYRQRLRELEEAAAEADAAADIARIAAERDALVEALTQAYGLGGRVRRPGSADNHNSHRPHRTLLQNPPGGRAHRPAEVTGMRVVRRDRLGGLIHEYAQVA
jgi:hypothetical protein